MKKVFKIVLLLSLLLAFNSSVKAAIVIDSVSDTQVLGETVYQSNDAPPDFSWTHTVTYAGTPTILVAQLDIAYSYGGNHDGAAYDDLIRGDNNELGYLTAGTFKSFDLMPYANQLLDGELVASIEVDKIITVVSGSAYSSTYLDYATLTIRYEYDDGYQEPEPNPTIPAPGAIFLGGFGVSLVGWLRRRRAL